MVESNSSKHLKAQMIDKKDMKLQAKMTDKSQLEGNTQGGELSASDIDNMVSEEETLRLRPLPYIKILGRKINTDSLIVGGFSFVLWISIWKFFDLFEIGWYSFIFFISYLIVLFINIINSASESKSNLEVAMYEIEKQISNGIAMLGVVIILFVFLYNIQMDSQHRDTAYKILLLVLSLCTLGVVKYDTKNDTRNIRVIRLAIQKLYNQASILLVLCFVVIYFGILKK